MTTTATFDIASQSARASLASPRSRTESADDGTLRVILAKSDDRLLRDVGLTREDVIGPAETFWAEWRRNRDIWNL